MKRFTLLLAFCMTFALAGGALAQSNHADLLARLLAIAEPDQIEAYDQLDLTPMQMMQLRSAAADFIPRVEQMKNTPGGALMLVPEAMSKLDSILTPAQRPLARRLMPRSHQWPKLRALFQEYRQS